MSPVEIFSKHWNETSDKRIHDYSLKDNLKLGNGSLAQLAIFKGDECIAFGNYYEKLQLPTDDENRAYFHGVNGFVGCGTSSLLWFYFDDENIIINDHKWIYPYDELMKDYCEFLDRLTEQAN